MKSSRLKLVVMHVSTRCDQTCAHCSIWRGGDAGTSSLSATERKEILTAARRDGATTVLFTGGEPFLDPGLPGLTAHARSLGLSVQIATNGLAFGRCEWVLPSVDEIYVSFEGPADIHDRMRGRGASARLAASLSAIAESAARPRLVARSTITSRNARRIDEVARAAITFRFDALSFLPLDSTSLAFGGAPGERASLAPGPEAVGPYLDAVSRIETTPELRAFVSETPGKLRSFADRFSGRATPPACNAPEWSSVIEADGRVRPCFFQPVVSRIGGDVTLSSIRSSPAYAKALAGLGARNETCRSCVCPKDEATRAERFRRRVAAALLGSGRVSSEDGRAA